MNFVNEFGPLLVELEKWQPRNKVALGLDSGWRRILEVATTEEHNKRKIWVVGQSGCGLGINMKYVGKRTNAVKHCGYFQACSAVVMSKSEAWSVCTK